MSTIEPEDCFAGVYRGKKVLVTGHTGFKGSWLCEWLIGLGATVTGVSLPPPTTPSLFDQLRLAHRLQHILGDVRDLSVVLKLIKECRPEFIFHLAAQPLVRLSYVQPVETYATNILGTVHVLEAVRLSGHPCVIVAVTTDKCYENKEWVHSYREDDPLGGLDPYSSSKAAAELVISGYRRSYFLRSDSNVHLASARAGNVIGGGDWALDRIMPDCIRSLSAGVPIPVRNKTATRPWQHVLEPLSGYLWLAACLAKPGIASSNATRSTFSPQLACAFNFGPPLSSNRTVADLVRVVLKYWPGQWVDKSDPTAVHEAQLLNLATDKAKHLLGWQALWNFEQTVEATILWYRHAAIDCSTITEYTRTQIAQYTATARAEGVSWTQ